MSIDHDVKALAERLCDPEFYSRTGKRSDLIKAADMLDRLASQREDVIDREAIARIIDPSAFDPKNEAELFHVDMWKRNAYAKADAIIRSLPSRESIIEECAETMRDAFFEAMKDYVLIGPGGVGIQVFNAIRNLAAQPRSNRVEDGAERNSIQIESSSDTASAPLSPATITSQLRDALKFQSGRNLTLMKQAANEIERLRRLVTPEQAAGGAELADVVNRYLQYAFLQLKEPELRKVADSIIKQIGPSQ